MHHRWRKRPPENEPVRLRRLCLALLQIWLVRPYLAPDFRQPLTNVLIAFRTPYHSMRRDCARYAKKNRYLQPYSSECRNARAYDQSRSAVRGDKLISSAASVKVKPAK